MRSICELELAEVCTSTSQLLGDGANWKAFSMSIIILHFSRLSQTGS